MVWVASGTDTEPEVEFPLGNEVALPLTAPGPAKVADELPLIVLVAPPDRVPPKIVV
jgi:hypothetical protein